MSRTLLLDAFVLLLVAATVLRTQAQQLDGGVYDSPAAQEYWKRRLGKEGLNAARAATKLFVAQEAASEAETTTGEVDLTTATSFKKSKFRKPYYIPSFAGTYASPSPYWISRAQP